MTKLLPFLILLSLLTSCSAFKQAKSSKYFILKDSYSSYWRGSITKTEGTVYNLKLQIKNWDESMSFDCMWIGNEFMAVDASRPQHERQLPVTKGSIWNIKTVKSIKNTKEEEGVKIIRLPEDFKNYILRGKQRYTALMQYSVGGERKYFLVSGFDEFNRKKSSIDDKADRKQEAKRERQELREEKKAKKEELKKQKEEEKKAKQAEKERTKDLSRKTKKMIKEREEGGEKVLPDLNEGGKTSKQGKESKEKKTKESKKKEKQDEME